LQADFKREDAGDTSTWSEPVADVTEFVEANRHLPGSWRPHGPAVGGALQLPVHRIGKGKRSPIFTTPTEVNFWLSATGVARQEAQQSQPGECLVERGRPMEDAHRLLARARELAEKVAENSVRQHQRAEVLQAQLLQMRSRMKQTVEAKSSRLAVAARSAAVSAASGLQSIPFARNLPGPKNAG
jgi:hypothetical protein